MSSSISIWDCLFDLICLHSQVVVIISHYSFTGRDLMVLSFAIQQYIIFI